MPINQAIQARNKRKRTFFITFI